MKYLTNIDLLQQELQNARIQNLTAAPTNPTPVEGQIYYNTVAHAFYVYNGTEWVDLAATGNMSGAAIIAAINGATGLIDADNLTDSHAHSNKAILDATEVAYTSAASAKLDSIAASANLYVHPTGDGNLHVPATSTNSSGKVLTAGATAGALSWETPTGGDWDSITNKPTSPASGIDAAVSASHAQNTDTGTSSATFIIGTGGPKIKNNSGELQARNNADNDYADLRVKNLVVEGTTTTVNSETIELADNRIVLNSNITASGQNDEGGIEVKRFKETGEADNAALYWSETDGYWYTSSKDGVGGMIEYRVGSKWSYPLGNGSDTSFVIAHYLNTRDLIVAIRRTGSPYDLVYADVEFTSLTTLTVKFATAPSTDEYTITFVG